MTLQTSGPISLSQIRAEFGGSAPDSISEYYGADDGVPTSGAIDFSDFYGKSAEPEYVDPQGQAFTGQVRMDNFDTVLFNHDYLCTRTVAATAGTPPNNVGYVQFNLPDNATGPDTGRTAYPVIRGNALSIVGGLGNFSISGTTYTGTWSTTTLEDGDFGAGYVVTYFSNTAAGEVMRHAEGSSLVNYAWF